jgi:hypothetical protein
MLDKLIALLLWPRVKAEWLDNGHSWYPEDRQKLWSALLQDIHATPSLVVDAITFGKAIKERTADRLTKRFDLSSAMNEAANVAMARKVKIENDPDPVQPLTQSQEMALRFQRDILERRLKGKSRL